MRYCETKDEFYKPVANAVKAKSNLSDFKDVQEFRILINYVKRAASINIIAK